jgi:glycine dehydrogenase subunit 2
MKLIFEKSRPGRRGGELPKPDVPAAEAPAELRRATPPRLPELAEPEILRHFTELSTRNFGIDTGFYPLGSCTMKYNPRGSWACRASATCTRIRRRRARRARSS